jgi:hypothetical protein
LLVRKVRLADSGDALDEGQGAAEQQQRAGKGRPAIAALVLRGVAVVGSWDL